MQLTASAKAANALAVLDDAVGVGETISGKKFTWMSSGEGIATVSSSGQVTAVSNGSVTITATTNGVNGTATVNVSQVATQLAFTVQPTDAVVGAPMQPAIEVQVWDALGSVVTDATDAVTMAIGTNPSGASLSGTTPVEAEEGVASFGDLSINSVGDGYTLVAASATLTDATSDQFDIQSSGPMRSKPLTAPNSEPR